MVVNLCLIQSNLQELARLKPGVLCNLHMNSTKMTASHCLSQ